MPRWAVLFVMVGFTAPGCRAQETGPTDVAPEGGGRPIPGAAQRTGRLRFAAAPEAGDVASIVREALARAADEKRRLGVYVGARWCEPCRTFHEAAGRGER